AAVHLGFPRHVARELVLDTMQGSAAFALRSGRHVAELRDMVTSPGGTSAEALYELERGRLRTVVSDAVWAAYERTRQLEGRLEGRDDGHRKLR
ncbi:MAG: pyrroline-5-carboxylate reductase, partial [Chloroflexota bacterium]|nr:pyrroline-5-carboxylate reductase [Chloroflexota bacterium]